MLRAAYALCAGCLAVAGLVARADAGPVTYSWETLSSVPSNLDVTPPLQLSFTVDGPVSVHADAGFADTGEGLSPATQVPYPFPTNLKSFDLHVGNLSVTLADFVSREGPGGSGPDAPGLPTWSIVLGADSAAMSANLSLAFLAGPQGTDQIEGALGSAAPATASTDAITTIYYGSDMYALPAEYSGMLVATATVPGPSSLVILLSGLVLFGAAGRHRVGRATARTERNREVLLLSTRRESNIQSAS